MIDLKTFSKLINKYNFNSIMAEDVRQEYELYRLEGKAKKQTATQFLIDYVRKHNGSTRNVSSSKRPQNGFSQFDDDIGVSVFELENRRDYFEYGKYLNKEDRIVFCLLFKWGFDETEVANIFGVSVSRISQRFKRIQERIRSKIEREKQGEDSGKLEALLPKKARGVRWRVECFEDKGMEIGEPFGVECYF